MIHSFEDSLEAMIKAYFRSDVFRLVRRASLPGIVVCDIKRGIDVTTAGFTRDERAAKNTLLDVRDYLRLIEIFEGRRKVVWS